MKSLEERGDFDEDALKYGCELMHNGKSLKLAAREVRVAQHTSPAASLHPAGLHSRRDTLCRLCMVCVAALTTTLALAQPARRSLSHLRPPLSAHHSNPALTVPPASFPPNPYPRPRC